MKFELIQGTTILAKRWKTDIVAATRYIVPEDQSTALYGFNATHAVQLSDGLSVSPLLLEQTKHAHAKQARGLLRQLADRQTD